MIISYHISRFFYEYIIYHIRAFSKVIPTSTGSRHWPRSRRDPCTLERGCSKKFRREWIKRFPWFQYERPYFVRTYRPVKRRQLLALSRAHSLGMRHVRSRQRTTCREHNVTTMQRISTSRQHRACVTYSSALYCYG